MEIKPFEHNGIQTILYSGPQRGYGDSILVHLPKRECSCGLKYVWDDDSRRYKCSECGTNCNISHKIVRTKNTPFDALNIPGFIDAYVGKNNRNIIKTYYQIEIRGITSKELANDAFKGFVTDSVHFNSSITYQREKFFYDNNGNARSIVCLLHTSEVNPDECMKKYIDIHNKTRLSSKKKFDGVEIKLKYRLSKT